MTAALFGGMASAICTTTTHWHIAEFFTATFDYS
jgi:hypothetical protein